MREVLGDCVTYISPEDISLDITKKEVDETLIRHSWQHGAELLQRAVCHL